MRPCVFRNHHEEYGLKHLSTLQQKHEAYKDKIVVPGGRIIAITVKGHASWVDMLEKKLDRQRQPEETDRSPGRFLIRFADFLNLAIYAPGRSLTHNGQVEGKMVRSINETRHTYPVLNMKAHYLRKPEDINRTPRFGVGVGRGVRG